MKRIVSDTRSCLKNSQVDNLLIIKEQVADPLSFDWNDGSLDSGEIVQFWLKSRLRLPKQVVRLNTAVKDTDSVADDDTVVIALDDFAV
ncbi:hypothetical protein HOLleu_26582 [Holothuria leucospilota]|uniref:Uncharacterized protein n=1 Tax=Holothuria leucospilota TaxID=206669 RepID=A0A9Q1BP66_HOLLE|nr:hypothetical protein HOLleu_26582 [Holothuria leucospilota]